MRCYSLWIPVETIMVLLGNWRHHNCVGLPWLERCSDAEGKLFELPHDYDVVDATYSWERKSIGIRISHPSFPEVPQGEYSPNLYFREVTIEARKIIGPQDEDAPTPLIVEAL